MLNVTKRAEQRRRMITGDNWRYDLGTDDIVKILEENHAHPTNEMLKVLVMAFHLGIVAGAKIAKKQAKA